MPRAGICLRAGLGCASQEGLEQGGSSQRPLLVEMPAEIRWINTAAPPGNPTRRRGTRSQPSRETLVTSLLIVPAVGEATGDRHGNRSAPSRTRSPAGVGQSHPNGRAGTGTGACIPRASHPHHIPCQGTSRSPFLSCHPSPCSGAPGNTWKPPLRSTGPSHALPSHPTWEDAPAHRIPNLPHGVPCPLHWAHEGDAVPCPPPPPEHHKQLHEHPPAQGLPGVSIRDTEDAQGPPPAAPASGEAKPGRST